MVEFYLICSVLFLLSVFVFYSSNVITSGEVLGVQINYLGSFLFLSVLVLYLNLYGLEMSSFSNSLVRDSISIYLSLLGSLGACLICFLSLVYLSRNSLFEYEFFLVVSLVLLGLYLLIFSNDLLSLYLGIELQSLGLYTLATMKTNSSYSTEAGLKYFVLGAFASSLLVLGMVFFYGVTGLLNFEDILYLFSTREIFESNNMILSVIFICVSLIFKIGGAPFHSWVPDVYEGAATIVTFFFALVPKISIVSVLIKLSYLFHVGFLDELSNLLLYCGILSVFVGSLGALGQHRIKRVLSYSAIGHGGFLLWALSLGNLDGFLSLLFYISIYCALVVMLFSSLLGLQQKNISSPLKLVGNLSLIYKANFWLSVSFIMGLFSILGIPPLSGFFSKLLVLIAGINEGYWLVSGLFIIASVVSSVYYLRLIKSLVFSQKSKCWTLFSPLEKSFGLIVSLFFMFNLLFILVGDSFIQLLFSVVYEYSMVDKIFTSNTIFFDKVRYISGNQEQELGIPLTQGINLSKKLTFSVIETRHN